MYQLTIIDHNGILVADSREVAVMLSVRHSDLLEKVEAYIQYLENGKIRFDSFFIESSYEAGTGKAYKCYLLTRKGCDMIAHKMTGEKGVLFTAAYVTRFEEMEKQLNPQSIEDVLIIQLQSMKELRLKQAQHEENLKQQEESIKLLRAKIETHPTDYFSIAGYASLRGVKVDVNVANLLGRKAAELSREYGIEMGKVTDPRFGQVNTYHLDILKEVFAPRESRVIQ